MLHTLLPPYFSVLQRCVNSAKWEEALKLCRFIDVGGTIIIMIIVIFIIITIIITIVDRVKIQRED